LLSQYTVDLILWKDNTGNPGLAADYVAEWRRHPNIPVVRLYGKGAAVPTGADPRSFMEALAVNLPSDGSEYQLFSALSRCLTRSAPQPELRMVAELDFRRALPTLWAGPTDDVSTPATQVSVETGCETAVTITERDLLREHPTSRRPYARGAMLPWHRAWSRLLSRHRRRHPS
jgi:hypothetical protein